MDCTLAFVADAANADAAGKLNVLGIFDRVQSPTFPYLHPQMSLVVNLAASPSEFGKKKDFEIDLVDPDGRLLTQMKASGEVPRPEPGARGATMQIVLQMVNTPFPKPGPYAIEILVGGDSKARIPIDAILVKVARKRSGPKK